MRVAPPTRSTRPALDAGLGQELEHLLGHHVRQRQDDVVLVGLALVELVGAVALHEDRAARREPAAPWRSAISGAMHRVEAQVHALELLREELAGARGALVAGVGVDDAAAGVEPCRRPGPRRPPRPPRPTSSPSSASARSTATGSMTRATWNWRAPLLAGDHRRECPGATRAVAQDRAQRAPLRSPSWARTSDQRLARRRRPGTP